MPKTRPNALLARYFARNGVLRTPNRRRRTKEKGTYKKGYEVRLIAFSRRELTEIRRALRAAGFDLGRAFKKVNRLVQPVYGKAQVERFLALIRA
jgi:hypothetical protein